MRSRHHMWLLGAAALFLFGLNIWGYDLWPPDEPRFAEVAREMMESGDYLTPRVNGLPYEEKPPLLFWMIALVSAPIGEVNEWTARIPSVLSGLAVVLFTYALANSLFGAHVAIWSAIVLMTSFNFWWHARTARIDMLLAACMAAAMYGFWRWEEERRKRWLAFLFLAIVAATYAKGPMGLLFSLLFVFAFYWGNPIARRQLHWFAGSVAVVAAVAAWYVPARYAVSLPEATSAESAMAANLLRNTIGRFLGVSKAQGPWYYFYTVPKDMLPWSLMLPWIVVWTWRRRGDNKMIRFLLCWTLPAFVFLSIALGKQAQYLLPLFPAFAILTAAAMLDFLDSPAARARRILVGIWGGLLCAAGIAGIAAVFIAARIAPELVRTDWSSWRVALLTPDGTDLLPRVALFAATAMVLGGYALLHMRKSDVPRLHILFAWQSAVVYALAATLAFPVVNDYKSAKMICEPTRQLAASGMDFDLYSVGFSREEYVFYSRHFHEPILMNIIGADRIATADFRRISDKQRRARKLIAQVVQQVAVADMERITPEESVALLRAVDAAIDATGDQAAAIKAFEDELQDEIDAFARRFAASRPALLFVQDEDWRWIYPLHRDPPEYHDVRHRTVGSRNVLLLANQAAWQLLRRTQ
ncbi:MAG TPA: glycosyltransferase family 39 protein [Candidatus Hydrogenedentes bacterium]|nr:glycosyltransferase family 39 protein [Candidatus Hydrogenedentota bacterium]